jgi:hypothetical protein
MAEVGFFSRAIGFFQPAAANLGGFAAGDPQGS